MGASCCSEQAPPPLLYHGSAVRLDRLEPRSSRVLDGEAAVFATPHRWMAVVFAVRWTDADIADFGAVTDMKTGERTHVLEETRPGAIDALFRGQVWLYTLSGDGFRGDPRLGMPNDELICRRAVTPLRRERVDVRVELINSPLVIIRK